jgi:transmembrane sensor
MTWLESPQSEAEKLIRDGLDQAAKRTGDEITHRRVWANIAEATELTPPRSYRLLAFASATLVVLLGAAGVFAYPHLRGKATSQLALVNHSTQAPSPVAIVPPAEAVPASPLPEQVVLDEAERAPGHVVRTGVGERARVALGGGAEAELDENSAITWDKQHRPAVEQGSARLSVPHQPPGWRFSVTAGPYVVTVVGTKFEVRVASRTVGVEVTEGVVEVWRGSHSTRLVAGDAWHGPLSPDDASTAQPAPKQSKAHSTAPRAKIQTDQHLLDAQAALQAGNVNKALDILNRAAQGNGPAAENAAYELGRITRYDLNHPRQAVALWEKYRTRFPSGLLRTETDLSIVETLSHVGEVHAALAEAEAFLARHPDSERRGEVQRLAERLRATEAASDAK